MCIYLFWRYLRINFMLLAAGLTPAWQRVLEFDDLHQGEVNRARAVHAFASGKVLNVGLALHHLGAQAVTLAPLGGPNGERIRREFAELDASVHWLPVAEETRICTTLICGERHTELVEPSAPLTDHELHAFADAWQRLAAAADVAILTGSLPSGTPADWYRRMLDAAPHLRAVLDAQGGELLAALHSRPLVVKPNRRELAKTLRRTLDRDDELAAAMQEIHDLGAQWVVVTDGSRPVHVLGAGGHYRLQPPVVQRVVNPIGCGDCLAAGLAWGLARGLDMIPALALGLGCAADRLGDLRPGRLDAARVSAYAAQVEVCKV